MIRRKSAIKRIAMLLVVATLLTALTIPVLAAPVTDTITVPAGQDSFSIDIYVNEPTAYAGIEFALTISNESAATFASFTPVLSGAIASPFIEKDGLHYFGFYADSNMFPTGEKLVGKLQFTGYTGNQAFTVTVEKMTVVRIVDNKAVKTENESPSHVFSVRRAGVVPADYAVTFNPNGGTRIGGGELVQTLPEGGKAAAPVVTRSGYDFAGWYKDSGLTIPWNFDEDTVTGDITLYAKWDEIPVPVNYTVNFNSNGGSAVDPVTVISGGKLTKPADPTREGYTFVRWYKDSGLTYAWDFDSDTVTKDLTLYAKWKEISVPVEYTVTFNSNGGSIVNPITVTSGDKLTKPVDPTREGYTFVGWCKDSNCIYLWDFEYDTVTKNLVLYACWKEIPVPVEYTVSFNSNGGSTVAPMTVTSGDKLEKPGNPTREGYTFAGWFKDSGLIYAWDFSSDTVTGNMTLYARWNILPEGTVVVIENKADGSVVTTETRLNGVKIVTKTTKDGKTTAEVTIPEGVDVTTVIIPMNATSGNVAYVINADGTKYLVRKSYVTNSGVFVPVNCSTNLEIVDNSKPFDDVKSADWFNNAVNFVSSHELFEGTAKRIFSPGAHLTRAMLVTVLHRLEDMPEGNSGSFPDVPADTWYTKAVAWAKEVGITIGTDTGMFEPEANITRESLALMLYRYAELIGMDNTGRIDYSGFSDSDSVSKWAKDAMSWAVSEGIVRGTDDNKLNPGANATRAEAAAMLMRFIEAMYK